VVFLTGDQKQRTAIGIPAVHPAIQIAKGGLNQRRCRRVDGVCLRKSLRLRARCPAATWTSTDR
jgi:hypothetical protein